MEKKHAKIDEIRAAIKKVLPKAISEKLLEFNKKFQELGSKPEEEKRHEEERKMFEIAQKGMKETKEEAKQAEKKTEGSAWNENAYHWEEKAVSEWANARLKELLTGCCFEADGEKAKVVAIKNLGGDVSAGASSSRL